MSAFLFDHVVYELKGYIHLCFVVDVYGPVYIGYRVFVKITSYYYSGIVYNYVYVAYFFANEGCCFMDCFGIGYVYLVSVYVLVL